MFFLSTATYGGASFFHEANQPFPQKCIENVFVFILSPLLSVIIYCYATPLKFKIYNFEKDVLIFYTYYQIIYIVCFSIESKSLWHIFAYMTIGKLIIYLLAFYDKIDVFKSIYGVIAIMEINSYFIFWLYMQYQMKLRKTGEKESLNKKHITKLENKIKNLYAKSKQKLEQIKETAPAIIKKDKFSWLNM